LLQNNIGLSNGVEVGVKYANFESNSVTFEDKHYAHNKAMQDVIRLFPKTRYYGSKKRILNWIYENLKDLEFETVLDCFGGTASVSLLFQAMGKHVTYHDALKSNSISAKVLLSGGISSTQLQKYEKFFRDIKIKKNGYISKTFDGMYFTKTENMWLDGALEAIKKVKNSNDKNIYLYVLFQSMLMKRPFNLFHRANLYIREAQVKRSFGNLATWNTSFADTSIKVLLELHKLPKQFKKDFQILKPSSAEIIPSGYDLVYIDPPYISSGSNSDGYWKKYHFLEGLVNYDKWNSILDINSKLKMPVSNKHIQKWETKNEFKQRLFELILKHKNSIVALSYMTNAIPTIGELEDFFRANFKSVVVNLYPLSHALSPIKRTEILIIGIPND